ncbi:MAG: protein kinase [Deltaproteobacteria bacterium]|nr:protein kinase [Deltaproteobacteria bacterium]MBW2414860.1 protein kinase [Deltaproteobacteria bacterium]
MTEGSGEPRPTEGTVLLERFTLVRALDTAGATALWLAEDAELEERVALRILDPALPDAQRERMRSTCRTLRRLRHPHIVPVYDFYRGDVFSFLSREYVEGGAVDSLQGLPASTLGDRLAPLVDALAYAHGQGVAHGDLRASKLRVDAAGHVRITDFALSAALAGADADGERAQEADRSALAALWLEVGAPGSDEARRVLQGAGVAPAAIDAFVPLLGGAASSGASGSGAPGSGGESLADGEVLVPVDLGRRSRTAPTGDPSTRNLYIAAAAGVLAVLLIVVLFALPRWVERSEPEAPRAAAEPAPEPAKPAPAEGTVTDATQAEVQGLLGRLLNRRRALGERSVETWAADEIADVDESISSGEQAQLASSFDAAAGHYREAGQAIDALEVLAGEVLARALEAGDAALGARDVPEALRQYQLAARVDPGNADAAQGLDDAEALQKVLTLTATGEESEQDGKLEPARDAFSSALQVDPDWEPARTGLARVEERLRASAYEREMALAVSALAGRNLGTADEHVRAALKLEPGSADARDLARRIEQKRLAVTVAAGRRRAEAYEANEQWTAATNEYRKLLDRDPDLAFALQGFERSEWRASVSDRFDAWIGRPALLFDDGNREDARNTLRKAREVPDPGPRLRRQIDEVADIERVASTPMRIVFKSDGLTDVQISRVGGLGTFARREVPLKPGRYVVRGVRRGFRDVRKTVDVIPGRVAPTVDVRCIEEI